MPHATTRKRDSQQKPLKPRDDFPMFAQGSGMWAKKAHGIEANHPRRSSAAADVHMKAMIFLAFNCGFGPMGPASLPTSAIDLDRQTI